MLDYPVNIREQPNLDGLITGKLFLNDEIEIVENCGNMEEIDGVLQNWYKIKSREITGYIFGGYTAVQAIEYDIDKNGEKDFVYFRVSNIHEKIFNDGEIVISSQIYPTDIFVYINNKRIPNTTIEQLKEEWSKRNNGTFYRCSIEFDDSKNVNIILWLKSNGEYVYQFTVNNFDISEWNVLYSPEFIISW
ncbi:hypothetical protein FACS1894147_02900 [Spirochaetia bacterium]|nr:hypothetical protein FACS1894147_02900 [Spirochaetia bacterium]